MKLIVALGNPGQRYEFTRHNAGFLVLDKIAHANSFVINQNKFNSFYVKTELFGQGVVLIKPQTFMNLSGRSVRQFKDYYNVELFDLIVIHDDIDMPVNTIKSRVGGGAGGHNGIRSIIQELGSQEFHRIKLGVGKPTGEQASMAIEDWVLAKFSQSEIEMLNSFFVEQTLLRLQQIFQQQN